MEDDHTLLRRFANSGDEDAFTELVRRHLGMVHGICLRRTGNRELAEELVQNVFASLARKADSLKPGVLIVGWLHRSARFESLSAFRSESSRQRNMKSYMDFQTHGDREPDTFRDISPFLDQALDALPSSDRDVILLRFASDLSLQQVGEALGKSESAAQRHLQRVLEKLAAILRRHGVTTSAATLALFLGADFAKAAPLSLTVASVSKAAIASAAATSGASIVKFTTLFYIMKNKTIIIASICLLATAGSIAYVKTRPSSSAVAAKGQAPDPIAPNSKDSVTAVHKESAANSPGRRQRPASEHQDLDERFGASRVRLAKSACDNLIKIMGSMVEMLELQQSAEGNPMIRVGGGHSGDPLTGVVPGLTLSAEQKEKVKSLQSKRATDKLEKLRISQANLKKNRTDIMELMLSGDAVNQGKLSTGEFQELVDHKKDSLLADLGGSSDSQGGPIEDEAFRSELPSILDKDQMAVFEEFRTKQAVEKDAKAVTTNEPSGMDASASSLSFNLGSDLTAGNAQSLEETDESFRKASVALDGIVRIMKAVSDK